MLKKGLALTPVKFGISFNLSHLNQAGALVHVYTDGSVLVNHGGTEMGQGVNTKVCQVVAHELGIDLARVRATATDTSKVANTSATAASTGADLNGQAAAAAARGIRQRLAAFAARTWGDGAAAAEVRFADDDVHVGARAFGFAEVVGQAYLARVQLWSEGFYATPGLHWDASTLTGHPFYYFAYGAAVSEVIDRHADRRVAAAARRPAARRRRLDQPGDRPRPGRGRLHPGHGLADHGRAVPGRRRPAADARAVHLQDPGRDDCPADFRVRLFHNPNRADTILRSKAVGEPPLLLAFSVWFALRDAIAAGGDGRTNPPLRAPATPEAILDAVDAVRAHAPRPRTRPPERAAMHAWIAHLARLTATATPAVLVTVAATRGSTPRAPGARMIVTFDGSSHGSIGGGRLEQRANEIARELLAAGEHAPRLERFALGASLGQCCGGVVHLLFEPVGAAQHAWIEHAAALASAGRAWGRRVTTRPTGWGRGAGVRRGFARARVPRTGAGRARAQLARRRRRGCPASRCARIRTRPPAEHGGSDERLASDPSSGDGKAPIRHRRRRAGVGGMVGGGGMGDGGRRRWRKHDDRKTGMRSCSTPARHRPCRSCSSAPATSAARSPRSSGRLPLRVRWIDPRAEEFPAAVASNIEVRCTDTPESEVRHAPADAVFLVLTHSHALDFELVRAILDRDDFRLCGLLGSQLQARELRPAPARTRRRRSRPSPGCTARSACPGSPARNPR